jgi:tetratricopeptide (TPR) repeat protein
LSALEQTSEEHLAYNAIIKNILELLSSENTDSRKAYQAFVLLFRASAYDADANMCATLGSAVVTAMHAQRNQTQIATTIDELKKEIQHQQSLATLWASTQTMTGGSSGGGRTGAGATGPGSAALVKPNEMKQGFAMKEAAALQAQIGVFTARREVSALQARIQFQALMVQFFIQRRFQHVVIACQLYPHLFPEGDGALKLEGQSKAFFTKDVGVPPTVNTLQSFASEAMRDVREGVQAYLYLAEHNEMESATKRLGEAFVVGEYLPEIRTLAREKKRLALAFLQRSNRLLSALEVRDYGQAELVLKELDGSAKDFDATKPRAAIETAKRVSAMHLARARNAAIAGDQKTFEAEIREATVLWPLNPALAEATGNLFAAGDLQAKALADLDQLLSHGNIRQVFNDKLRFIAAAATSPVHQEKLRKVLEDMQKVETAIAKADEYGKRGDAAGAWEAVERAARLFPDDIKLNQLRGNLSSEAAGFVQALKTAQQLEGQGQTGSSLSWYLKAQRQYPLSEFAREGIERLVAKLLPAAS